MDIREREFSSEITRYETKTEDYYCTRRNEQAKGRLQCRPHLHYHIEFGILHKGNTTFFVDSVEYKMESGDIFIAFPNQIHRYDSVNDEQYDLIIANPDTIPELSGVFSSCVPRVAVLKRCAQTERLGELIGEICRATTGSVGQYRELILKGFMLSFFGELLSLLPLSDSKLGDSHAVKAVVNYCTKNFSKDLSLSILENELHISKYYISHLFSNKLKVRFNDYINSLRISEACRRLRRSDDTVTEISEAVAAVNPVYYDVLPLSLEEIFIYELGGVNYEVKNIILS